MPAPTVADLIFSSEQANHNFSRTLGELKRSTLSIHNRLNSILSDAAFAQRVASAYGRPLIANERCGSWYIDPARKGGSAYFKSTDGHQSVWKFSTRRLNLHLLEVVGANDGCIIVDSTRRGKSMPDSLSKTIPIWCSVINRFLFPNEIQYHDLYTPPRAVSESENAQITALLPSFVKALQDLKIQPDVFRKYLSKPIRPIWVTPDSGLADVSTVFEDFHPIVCCTVSRRVAGGEHSEGGYIQGAGDDTENWAYGLTPTIFWEHQQTLLSTSEADLPDYIKMLVRQKADLFNPTASLTCVKPTSYLFITELSPVKVQPDSTGPDTITIALRPEVTEQSTWRTSSISLDVGIGPHKNGQKNLRTALPSIIDFVKTSLFPDTVGNGSFEVPSKTGQFDDLIQSADKHIIIACETGKDVSIGVGLAIVCLFFDDDGRLLRHHSKRRVMTKDFVKSRLAWFSTSMPDANPSRGTLQSVNSFLMDHRREN